MKGSVFTLRNRNHLLKTLYSTRVTLLCGLLTFVVLRSLLGAGKFGTPAKDYDEIRHHLHRFKLRHQQKLLLTRELTDVTPREDTSRSTLSSFTRQGSVENAKPGHAFDDLGFQHRPPPRMPRILLVTGHSHFCRNAMEAQFLLKFLKNKINYCRLHDIEIFYDLDTTAIPANVRFLRDLMHSHPKAEWIWWMDSLAMITNISSRLAFERYAGYNVVQSISNNLSGKDGALDVWHRLWVGGSFLLRNCEWSHKYLENEGQMQEAEVFVETSMEMYEPSRGDRPAWPLVTHFGRCSLCGTDSTDHHCVTDMRRAFHYVDTQKVHIGSL